MVNMLYCLAAVVNSAIFMVQEFKHEVLAKWKQEIKLALINRYFTNGISKTDGMGLKPELHACKTFCFTIKFPTFNKQCLIVGKGLRLHELESYDDFIWLHCSMKSMFALSRPLSLINNIPR